MYGQEITKPRRSLDDLWAEMDAETAPKPPVRKKSSLNPATATGPQLYGPPVTAADLPTANREPYGPPVTPAMLATTTPAKPKPDPYQSAVDAITEVDRRKQRAIDLYRDADTSPDSTVQAALRAQADLELESANKFGQQAARQHRGMIEVGWGKDADPNSARKWVYAKPTHPEVAARQGQIQETARRQQNVETIRRDYQQSNPVSRFLQRTATRYLSGVGDGTPQERAELEDRQRAMGIDGPAETPNWLLDKAARFGRGAVNMIPGAASGIANLSDTMYRTAQRVTGNALPESADWAPVVEPIARQVERNLAPIFPVDPARNEDFSSKVASGFGSAAGFGAIGSVANAARIPTSIAIGTAGAGLGADEMIQEARAAGLDPAKDPARWDKMVALGGASGMTEIFGFGKTLERWGLKRLFVKRALEVLEEGGQEALQQFLGNVNAAYVGAYDPNRGLDQGIVENAIIGGLVGGGAQVADIVNERMDTRAVRKEPMRPYNFTPSVPPGTQTQRVTVPPSFVQKINQPLPGQSDAVQEAVSPGEPPSLADAPKGNQPLPGQPGTVQEVVPPFVNSSAPNNSALLFPDAMPAAPPAQDLSTLSPQERVAAMLDQIKQRQAAQQSATLEQSLNKEFADSSAMISSAAQSWDTDRPTAELMATTGANRLKTALTTLQKSEAYQTELNAVATGTGQPGPYIAAAQSLQQQLGQATQLFQLDAERERQAAEQQREIEQNQKQAEKAAAKQARFAEREQQKLARELQVEQRRAEIQSQRDAAAAKRMVTAETAKEKRRRELEQQRQQARDTKVRDLAQRELDRIALHDAALSAADAAGQRHQDYLNQGQTPEAINELIVQQKQLADAVKYLPRTPEAQSTKADLNRYQGQIGNRIGDLRKQASGKSGPVTQAIPPLLRPDAVVNAGGGVPDLPSFYEPGAIFDKLNPTLGDAEEDSTPLLTAVRRAGGIANDAITPGELRRLGVKESGTTGLVNNRGGLSPDRMREALVESGYLPEGSTVDDLYQAIEGEMRSAGRQSRPAGSIGEFFDQWEAEQGDAGNLVVDSSNSKTEPKSGILSSNSQIPGNYQKAAQNYQGAAQDLTGQRRPVEEPDADDEDMAALERALQRARRDNPRAYDERTRPGQPGQVSFSPFADLESNNRDAVNRLYDIPLNSDEARQIEADLRQFAKTRGIEQRHVDALMAYAANHQINEASQDDIDERIGEALRNANSVDEIREEIRTEIRKLPAIERTAIEREIAAIDALFEDEDMRNLLDAAVEGDEDSREEFIYFGERAYGITRETATDLISTRQEARRLRQEAGQRDVARRDAGRTAGESEAPNRRNFEPLQQLLRQNPATIVDADLDRYLTDLERWRNNAITGKTEIPESLGQSLREKLSATNDERKDRVKQGRLAPKHTPLPIPTQEQRAARQRLIEETRGLPPEEQAARLAELKQQQRASGESAEPTNKRKLTEQFDQTRTVSHPDPAIDGKPILAETANGRVVVANPSNQSGVSVVRDRAEKADTESVARNPQSERGRLAYAVADHLAAGKKFANIIEARKFISEQTGRQVKPGTSEAKLVDEAIEAGAVLAARQIVAKGQSPQSTYQALLNLNDRLPSLNARTSTSVLQQAYSTPLPLAYVASRLAGIDQNTTVYEPSAGHSALLISAKPENIVANELNEDRAAAIRDILPGAEVTENDAADWKPDRKVDRVITNPPFGAVKDSSGKSRRFTIGEKYETSEIDHAIAFEALQAMKDDGKAVLIVGGLRSEVDSARSDAYNTGAKRNFYFTLYNQYNVTDHFTVSGDLYAKQGAGWPVDVIVIDGRGKAERKLPAVAVPQILRTWDEVGAKLDVGNRNQNATTEIAADNVRVGESALSGSERNTRAEGDRADILDLPGVSGEPSTANDRSGTASSNGPGLFGGSSASGGPAGSETKPARRDGRRAQRSDLQQREATRPPEQSASIPWGTDTDARQSTSTATRQAGQSGNLDQSGDRGNRRTSDVGDIFDEEFDKLFGTKESPQSPKVNKTSESVRESKNAPQFTSKSKLWGDWHLSANTDGESATVTIIRRVFDPKDDGTWSAGDTYSTTIPLAGADGTVRIAREVMTRAGVPIPRKNPTIFSDNIQRLISDVLFDVKGQVKQSPAIQRTTKEAAKSAAKESKDTLKEIAKGLSDLFGGPKLSSGLTFDEKTYAAAKPHFAAAMSHFQQATRDVREVMANLLKELNQRFGFQPDVLQKMKPYIVRFVEEQTAKPTAQPAVSVGDYVTFSEPVIAYEKGQPFTTAKKVRGRVVGFKEDGRLDLKRADGGYAAKALSEVSVEPKPEIPQTATTAPATTTGEADAGASDTHRAYKPTSKSYSVGTLVPVNMADAVDNSLRRVREEVGDLDDYIADRLGYKADDLSKYFSGEQVDALALAVRNIENGGALILGDQTGIGKGRVVAGVIRYAIKKGLTPVFVTEKPTLYGDMIRDLADIGSADVKPLVTNAGESVPLDDEALEWYGEAEKNKLAGRAAPPKRGKFLQTKAGDAHNAMLKQFADTGKLGEYKAIFTTYNQMQSVQGKTSARHDLLRRMANNGIVIFDESHNAGGGGKIETDDKGTPKFDRAMFARELARNAKGLLYSSATFAKRPEVMDLYFRTELGKAVGDLAELAEITSKGGVPMQQVIASMLAESGQYIRRERSFKGVEYAPTPIKVERKTAENVSRAMREVAAFDLVKQEAVKTLGERVKAEAKRITGDGTVGQAGVSSVNFTSLMHNLIDQSLLSLKADQAADMAIAALERGEKPVITVANTMGSFIQRFAEENELQPGAPINLSFNDLLGRYLERSREVIVGKPYGEKFRHYLSDEELGDAGVSAYEQAKKFLESINLDMPISPIDWLHKRLREAGYRTGEITGRGHIVNYTADGPMYTTRPASETSTAAKKRTIAAFNDGTMDVIILNQSGSTGISLHASEKFKDQRRRHMIIAQAEKNIDTHMQMLGRVHRTGQVIPPRYTQMVADIPAELRPAAVLAKKMASLNANTTASRSSAVTAKDVPDFLNKYGDEVAAGLMENNPDLHALLGRPLKDSERKEGLEREDAMRKVTGRIPLLQISQQEEVYDQLISEYADVLQQAEAMGENALEAKTLDLQAETTKTQPLVPGSGQSLFEQAANLEKVKSNRQGKPFKSDEVLQKLQESLGSDARNLVALGQAGREQIQATRKDLEAEVAAYKNKVEEEHGGTKRAAVDQLAADKWFQRWQQLTGTVYPGATVQIAGGYGVVLNVERKGKTANPVALSGWRVTVAMSDARRQLSFPMSKLDFNESEGGNSRVVVRPGTTASVYDAEVGDFVDVPILDAFDKGLSSTKETRHIVTGNLIAGFSAAPDGQIVNFTDNEGRVRQGILMPTKFDPADVAGKQKEKLKTVDAVMGALTDARGEVTDREGNLTIRRAIGGGGYVFSVPSAKGRGGKYYLNRALLAAAGRDFAKHGGLMEVQVGESAARRMIEALQKGEGLPSGVGLQAKVTESRVREQKPETPTAATVLTDAQIQFKSGKRGQPGTLYANNAALDILRAAYEQSHGEQRYFANVNMNRTAAERIARALLAESQDTKYAPATQRKLREIAREFNLAAQSGNSVSIVETGGGRTFSSIKTSRRHELFHDAQEGLENSRGFLAKHEYAQQLIDGLAARGYAPEDRTVEAAAFIAGGQAKDFGLTEAQGNEFLEDYFDDIVKTNGAAALKRFFSVAPHAVGTLKQARQKYGIEVQGATGTDRSGARGEGEAGRLGANDRTPRQGEGLLQPAQSGRVREQRGIRASFGELENEPSGTVLGSGLGGFQGFTRGQQPKSSPYREIIAEHKPLVADPYKLQDHTIEELLGAGAKGTLPGARALHWASKLKLKRTADKLANRQADFITKTIEHTNDMIAASEAMRTAEPGSNDYQKAKRKFDNARLKIADALAKAGEYATPVGYTAKTYKSSLLSAPHIHLFNMLEQAFKMPLHQAQRAADAIVPASILNKYGIPYTKAITDFRDLIPAITSEARGLVAGLKEAPRDVVDMFRYGVTRQMHQADDAESGHAGGTDKFELGHRAKMIPGVDQVLNFIGRSHGAADIAFSNMVNATAISAQANAIARKIGKENGLSRKEMNDLARDLAYRPSALMVTLASDATLRFKLDYPTLAYDALQKLRDLPGSVLGNAAEKGAGKALDATWKAAMDFVVPFSKIPLAAVDTYLFRYSPVAFGRVAGRMAMAKGGDYAGRYKGEFAKQRFGEDTAELFRQGLIGSLSWALLGALGSFGYLSFTGGGEDDKDRRNVGNVREALRVGYGPEVRAGDYAFNLNRMGPVGQAAGIATRIYAAQKSRTDPKTGEPEDASKRITRTANAAKEGLIFNNPLGQAAKDIAGDDAHSTSAGQYVAGKLRGFVPGLARDIAKIQTPTKRMPEESSTLGRLKGDLQSGMPVDVGFGSREQMTERLDALGRPIEEPSPFKFWRQVPQDPQLDEMERLNAGLPKPRREQGESGADYNRRVAESGARVQSALRRVGEDQSWGSRSNEAKARIYSTELSKQGMDRAEKLSAESFQTEREIEALRADAYAALRELPSYQRLKDSDKEAARKQIDEQLKRFRARAASSRAREKVARMPEQDPKGLARMAVLSTIE